MSRQDGAAPAPGSPAADVPDGAAPERDSAAPDARDEDLLLERQLCFALSVASRSIVGAYRPVLDDLGLTHPQYLVLLALWEQSPRTVRNLSDALLMEPATLSPMLKRLEAAGLLTRGRAPGNDRALAVELTPKGRALRSRALDVPGTMMQRLGLEHAEVEELNRSMQRLITAAQAAATQPQAPAGA